MNIFSEKKYLFNYDVSLIKKELSNVIDQDWQFNTFRQKLRGHSETESIVFIFGGVEHKVSTQVAFNKTVFDAAEEIKKYYGNNAKIVSLMVTKLFAKKQIPEHIDGGNLSQIHRCHLPIITHKDCEFYINKKKFFFEEGNVFEINNVAPHAVVNNSDIDRVHLICDINE